MVIEVVVVICLRTAASSRAFPRTRLRNWGHNINQLINLCNDNVSADAPGPSAITDFLLTSQWRPREDLLVGALQGDQDVRRLRVSHTVAEIE